MHYIRFTGMNTRENRSPMRDPAAKDLLDWYDAHARVLPWRVSPQDRRVGVRPDPYGVWLSEIMLQQTTVATVRSYWRDFIARWPHVEDLAAAEDADVMAAWAGLGYYARARNLLKCARVVAGEYGGRFPETAEVLQKLPGIGPYTSAAIASIAFDQPATVVDGNVERVVSRLYEVETPLPKAKAEITTLAETLTPERRPGDYAQAIMDLGATICTPKKPACGICPWRPACGAAASGRQLDFPVKAPKAVKPTRHGYVYLVQSPAGWLVEERPAKGLLGGMLGFPTSEWSDAPEDKPPFDFDWQAIGEVRHTFTHFHLVLQVRGAFVSAGQGRFEPVDRDSLPTVFRKAYDLAQAAKP